MPSKRALKLQQNNKKQEIFKSGIPKGVPLFYTCLSYKIEVKMYNNKIYTYVVNLIIKAGIKNRFQNKRNKKRATQRAAQDVLCN